MRNGKIFDYISVHEETNQKIFFDGQIYDAFSLKFQDSLLVQMLTTIIYR